MPEPGNPQALSRYVYVLNNPLKYIDPTGHKYDPYGDDFGPDIEWDPEKQTEFDRRIAQEYALAYRDIVTKGETPMSWQKYIITNPESPWYGDSVSYEFPVKAVGWRGEASAAVGPFGVDVNFDLLFHLSTYELDIFATVSGTGQAWKSFGAAPNAVPSTYGDPSFVGSGSGLGVDYSAGPLFVGGNFPDNMSYTGERTITYGGNVSPPGLGGFEADVSTGGDGCTTWYVGTGGGAGASLYGNVGPTGHVVGFSPTGVRVGGGTVMPWAEVFRYGLIRITEYY